VEPLSGSGRARMTADLLDVSGGTAAGRRSPAVVRSMWARRSAGSGHCRHCASTGAFIARNGLHRTETAHISATKSGYIFMDEVPFSRVEGIASGQSNSVSRSCETESL
jgi:hypothetical protein